MIKQFATLARKAVRRTLRVASPESATANQARRMFWPLDLNKKFAMLASSATDAEIINAGLKLIAEHIVLRVVCEDEAVAARLNPSRVQIISYQDLARAQIPVVVMPSAVEEAKSIERLYRLWRSSGHNFNIYDAYNDSDICSSEQVRRYRNVELFLLPTVLWPTLYSNWGFINFLISDVVRDRQLDVLDMFAGSGVIGFCLKDETPIRSISFCDANFWAVRAIRETGKRSPRVAGPAWLSEGLQAVPASAQFDLIVGNPPHVDQSLMEPGRLPGSDPDWEAHRQFFEKAHLHLRPGGRIVFIEAILSQSYEKFYRDFGSHFPRYRLIKRHDFDNYACYAVTLGLAE
jgi:methyltransferase family protein